MNIPHIRQTVALRQTRQAAVKFAGSYLREAKKKQSAKFKYLKIIYADDKNIYISFL
jgi:stalled ribosome alternative rescue factor ArfA